jgi:outer membrane protein assembly factor BamD (BamD/ComL family)
MQAAKGDKKAAASLQRFIHDFPKNPRVSEAWVGLAELAFHSSPPRLDEARKDLDHAVESRPTSAAAERADYLRIWVEETGGGNESEVIELGKRFLQQHGQSQFAREVRMKLAELYYARISQMRRRSLKLSRKRIRMTRSQRKRSFSQQNQPCRA